jgi:2-polyprenyl-3-methyl-5-hydroxy-6-metoxy-1,4-benzoquinol methylase
MSSAIGVAPHAPDNPLYRGSTRPDILPLLPPLGPECKILEIGCGEGAFSASIPASERWGVEPHGPAAEIARTRLNTVLVGTFEDTKAALPHGYFDLVVCNDVIEHMTDHDGFLRSIQGHMKQGAWLVGSVPNVRFYGNLFNLVVARDWHYQSSGILDRTHFRFFTLRSLRRSLEDALFHVEHLFGINPGRRTGWNMRSVAERLFYHGIIIASGGAAQDISYLQLGFAAKTRSWPVSEV